MVAGDWIDQALGLCAVKEVIEMDTEVSLREKVVK